MSHIEWTDETWNPIKGCDRVSPGCALCYAVRDTWRMASNPNPKIAAANLGLVEKKANGNLDWTGVIRELPERLTVPLHWKAPRRVFVNSQSDLFHAGVSEAFLDQVFAIMALCPQHTFQVLTKRPERMRDYLNAPARSEDIFLTARQRVVTATEEGNTRNPLRYKRFDGWTWPLPNVWLGVSAENQETANLRVPLLSQTLGAVLFVSYEPALGPVGWNDLAFETAGPDWAGCNKLVDWIIVGGESGPGARSFNPEWARQTIQQGQRAGVAVFGKQMGAQPTGSGLDVLSGWISKLDAKGGNIEVWPEDLRVREFPTNGEAVAT